MYERKCANWLQSFAQWTLPRSEAPEAYIFWTGIFTLASALRRRVKIPDTGVLGGWECYPNLYILLVGPPALRKTTTANYADKLLMAIPELTASPEVITRERLVEKLTKSPDTSMYILSGEFGEFIYKSEKTMYSFLTNAYDGRRKIDDSTISRADVLAQSPCINMLGATTPVWIKESMPESVIGGGFASRVVFVYADNVRQRRMYYRDVDYAGLDDIRKDLSADLRHIANDIVGPYTIPHAVMDWVEEWYQKSSRRNKKSENQKLETYYERKPVMAHKLAMILHVAYSDDMILTQEDFEGAIAILDANEKSLPRIFRDIGRNPYTADIYQILEHVQAVGKCKRGELHDAFRHAATPKMLDELIEGLIIAQRIKMIEENGIAWLVAV